jgi:hypothetical protein
MPLHLVICPWLAFGYLLPFLDLAEHLASWGHHVSFISMLCNIARLLLMRPDSALLLEFATLSFPRIKGLPEGAESTNDVPQDKFKLLWNGFDRLVAPFTEFQCIACTDEGTRLDWVIADVFHH